MSFVEGDSNWVLTRSSLPRSLVPVFKILIGFFQAQQNLLRKLGGMVARIVFPILHSVSHIPPIPVTDPAPIPLEREPAALDVL
jgi:hypothetical protein